MDWKGGDLSQQDKAISFFLPYDLRNYCSTLPRQYNSLNHSTPSIYASTFIKAQLSLSSFVSASTLSGFIFFWMCMRGHRWNTQSCVLVREYGISANILLQKNANNVIGGAHNNNNIPAPKQELLSEIQPCNFPLLWLSVYTPPPFLAQFSILSLLAIPFPSVFSVSSLQENNPTITSRNSPSSAPKFTADVMLSSALTGASGGQTRLGKDSLLNVVYILTQNYLSVWFGKEAEQYYSNHLGRCQRTPVSLVFSLSFWETVKMSPGRVSKKLLWVA